MLGKLEGAILRPRTALHLKFRSAEFREGIATGLLVRGKRCDSRECLFLKKKKRNIPYQNGPRSEFLNAMAPNQMDSYKKGILRYFTDSV